MFVDQYWETSDPDHPLVAISWTFEYEEEPPEGHIMVCSHEHDRVAISKASLVRPAGKGPDHIIEKVRRHQALLKDPCYDGCPGWHISTVCGMTGNRKHSIEIQRCDACHYQPNNAGLGDLDVAALPEAQQALIEEYASS
jgi:hypothetical protein